MGSRKKVMADRLKEIKKVTAIAKLNDGALYHSNTNKLPKVLQI
mgnify:CR=1 FL=1